MGLQPIKTNMNTPTKVTVMASALSHRLNPNTLQMGIWSSWFTVSIKWGQLMEVDDYKNLADKNKMWSCTRANGRGAPPRGTPVESSGFLRPKTIDFTPPDDKVRRYGRYESRETNYTKRAPLTSLPWRLGHRISTSKYGGHSLSRTGQRAAEIDVAAVSWAIIIIQVKPIVQRGV